MIAQHFKNSIAELKAVVQEMEAHAEAGVEHFNERQIEHAKELVKKLDQAAIAALGKLDKLLGINYFSSPAPQSQDAAQEPVAIHAPDPAWTIPADALPVVPLESVAPEPAIWDGVIGQGGAEVRFEPVAQADSRAVDGQSAAAEAATDAAKTAVEAQPTSSADAAPSEPAS